MAKIYRAQADTAKASEFYEKAISLNPQNAEYSDEYADFITEAYNREIEVKAPEEAESNSNEVSDADAGISLVTVTFEDENTPKTEADKQYQKIIA